MKNIKNKINAILEYEEEILKARNYYYEHKDEHPENLKGLDEMNIQLRVVKDIKEILDI